MALSAHASAQEIPGTTGGPIFLKDRRYSEGPGVRVGNVELHPSVAGEIGYDSNWYSRSSTSDANIANGPPNFPAQGTPMMRITPSLTLSTLGPQRKEGTTAGAEAEAFRFRASLGGTYREFFGVLDPEQRNVSLFANARADVLPTRPFSVGVQANYARIINPNVFGLPDLSFNRHDVAGTIDATYTPGGGTLSWTAGYGARFALYENRAAVPFDNVNHDVFTRGRWNFRPRTALVYDASGRFLNYARADQAANALYSATPLRARLGFSGLITPRFGVLALGGWGASFINNANPLAPQFDSFIAQAEGRFFLTTNPQGDDPAVASLAVSTLSLGYIRDFQQSLLSNFYGIDRGYAKLVFFFAGRALVEVEAGAGALRYPRVLNALGAESVSGFTNVRADASIFGEYRFVSSVGLNATLRYGQEFSDTRIPVVDPTNANRFYEPSWQKFEAFLGVRWFM